MLSVSPDANLHLKSLQGTELCAAGPSSLQLLSPGLLQLHAQVLGRRSLGCSVHRGSGDTALCQHKMCHCEGLGYSAAPSITAKKKQKRSALKKEIH